MTDQTESEPETWRALDHSRREVVESLFFFIGVVLIGASMFTFVWTAATVIPNYPALLQAWMMYFGVALVGGVFLGIWYGLSSRRRDRALPPWRRGSQ